MNSAARYILKQRKNLNRALNIFNKETIFVLSVVLLMSSAAFAEIQSWISANELFPGDAFSITVEAKSLSAETGASIGGLQIPLTMCAPGRFCGIGVVPPQTVPGKAAIILKSGNETAKVFVTVKKPDYPERHIKLPNTKVDLSPDDIERVRHEAGKLNAIWPMRNKKLFKEEFVMPLPNSVSTGYGVKRIFNRKKTSVHQGVDVRGSLREEVMASNRGMALITEDLFFGGNTIILDHGDGIFTIYMHLDEFRVKPGEIAEKGQTIGLVGSTGRASGPHLHFGLKIIGISANPLSIMGLPVR
jgi:murein DD-endopeptidase MepM/ murein hydrolase activator NlpD